jgi:superfamily II DNA helicase RecQ
MREPQDGKPLSPEDARRQEEAVRSVVQYCQNDVTCRRTQVLSYFNQDFNPLDCGQNCNNCMNPGDVIEQDLTKHAVDAIQLVKDAGGGSYTQNHFAQVFKGSNTKEVKDKGHDKLKLHGAGSDLSRELVERLFGELLLIEALSVVSVPNRSGWSQEYADVGIYINIW